MRTTVVVMFVGILAPANFAFAAPCSTYPYILSNGQPADATQVMADFNCAALTQGASLNTVTLSGALGLPGGGMTTDGKLGIGTVSPNAWLDIFSGTNSIPLFRLSRYDNASVAALQMSIDPGDNTFFTTSNAALNLVTNWNAGTPISTMYLTSIGRVGIGTTSPEYTLHVNGSVAGTSAYNNLSDERLKKDITPIEFGLERILALRPITFFWKSVPERGVGKEFSLPTGDRQIGFVAQDVEKIIPEAVSTSAGKEKIKSLAESKIIPVLVAAVKELKAENDKNREELIALKAEVSALGHGHQDTALR